MAKFMRINAGRTFDVVAAALLVICVGSTAAYAGQLYNTGVDNFGNPLSNGAVDTHYTVTSSAASLSDLQYLTPNLSTYTVNNDGIFPQDAHWLPQAADDFSAWIDPTVGAQSVDPTSNGIYDYQTTFTLDPGTDLSTILIFGKWAADNCGLDILLNGVSTGNAMSSCSGASVYSPFNQWTLFNPIASGFVIGTNTLDFLVENYGQSSGNPTGLRVNAVLDPITRSVDVPEPLTLSVFGTGLAGAIAVRRRRKAAKTE